MKKPPHPTPDGKWNDIATTEPAEEGVYFVRGGAIQSMAYAYWTGLRWNSFRSTVSQALAPMAKSQLLYHPETQWCGVK